MVGAAVAALAYPLLFLVQWPVEIRGFLVGIFSTTEINYWWMLGCIATVLLLPVVGHVWLEAGREPPPSVDPPFSPLAYQEHVVWSHLVTDQQLAPALRRSRGAVLRKRSRSSRGSLTKVTLPPRTTWASCARVASELNVRCTCRGVLSPSGRTGSSHCAIQLGGIVGRRHFAVWPVWHE